MAMSAVIESATRAGFPVRPGAGAGADILGSCSVLVVDDEPGIRNFLQRALQDKCALLEVAGSVEAAEAIRQRCHFDLLVVDIRLPGQSGIDWLESLRAQGARSDVIFISAYADLDTAIAALRAGAADLLLKPFRMEQLMTAVQRSVERRRMQRENFLLRRERGDADRPRGLVGHNPRMRELTELIARVGPTASTVLIEGETGTGKELVARAVHEASGRQGAFVAVNCGSISPELLESELFGHVRGAFTGAHAAREGLFSYAEGGTLFLDEVSEMAYPMQSKLLRALETRSVRPVGSDREVPVDCRVIGATNRRLEDEVREGRFREDLFYRLNVLSLSVPALRERRDDIPMLAQHFSESMAPGIGVPPIPFTHEDMVKLQGYDWPGNVRELRNVIERSLLLGRLPAECCNAARPPAAAADRPVAESAVPLGWTLSEVEKHYMLRTLESVGGNKSEAARRLGVSRKTMERRLNAWNGES
jgi:two-component system NtrC family response regulator